VPSKYCDLIAPVTQCTWGGQLDVLPVPAPPSPCAPRRPTHRTRPQRTLNPQALIYAGEVLEDNEKSMADYHVPPVRPFESGWNASGSAQAKEVKRYRVKASKAVKPRHLTTAAPVTRRTHRAASA
jgi:hypothetical protein